MSPARTAAPSHAAPAVDASQRSWSSRTRPADDELASVPLCLRLPDGREVRLDSRAQTTLGSDPDCDVVLAGDGLVSARHCVILHERGRTVVRDLSLNGTWIAGARLRRGDGELRPGLLLTLGHTALRVVARDASGDGMVGTSPALQRARRAVEKAAPIPVPVLVLGESGTGKELAARALHEKSGRTGRFVAVNCGALSPELVESELFGHEKGSFTGAVARKVGFFEEADGGTLFLDEIGELSLAAQPKLLRVLEQGMIRPVGAASERRVDVRVVAATHRDLEAWSRRGAFRLDLYHRLCVMEVKMPALRERAEDIPLLARHFLDEEITAQIGPRELSPRAALALVSRRFAGNVRELRNVLRRAAVECDGTIEPEHLPPEAPLDDAHDRSAWAPPYASAAPFSATLAGASPLPRRPAPDLALRERPAPAWDTTSGLGDDVARGGAGGLLRETEPPATLAPCVDEYERAALLAALRRHRSARQAALSLGLPKSTFFDKLQKHGLVPDRSQRKKS